MTHGATWPFKSSKVFKFFYILSLPIPFQEPCNKRVKPVAKSNSLTGVITPAKTSAFKRIQSISVCPPPSPEGSMPAGAIAAAHVTILFLLFFCFARCAPPRLAALHQFSHRASACDLGPAAAPRQGLVLPSPAQQPVLERHGGESRPHGQGDQTTGGECVWVFPENQTFFSPPFSHHGSRPEVTALSGCSTFL